MPGAHCSRLIGAANRDAQLGHACDGAKAAMAAAHAHEGAWAATEELEQNVISFLSEMDSHHVKHVGKGKGTRSRACARQRK
jgi:hypothetical protein